LKQQVQKSSFTEIPKTIYSHTIKIGVNMILIFLKILLKFSHFSIKKFFLFLNPFISREQGKNLFLLAIGLKLYALCVFGLSEVVDLFDSRMKMLSALAQK